MGFATATDYKAVDDSGKNHQGMMEVENASGKRNWRNIMLAFDCDGREREEMSKENLETKVRGTEVLDDCHQQRQNGHRSVARHRDRKCRFDVTGGGDGAVTKAE